jgi:hypothetical protein
MPDLALADGDVLTSTIYTTGTRQQVITQCTSATRPTGVEGRKIYETDTDLEYTHDGTNWILTGGTAGWTSFTTQIDQGATTNIAKTVNYSKWERGPRRTITWTFTATLSGAGTASAVVSLTLPATAASVSGVVGTGFIYDSSTTTKYNGTWTALSTTQVVLQGDWSGANSWGVTPNLALAASDVIQGSITYEAAA